MLSRQVLQVSEHRRSFETPQVKMVTGDQLAIAVETSRRLGLGTNIMEGKALMAGATLNDELATQVNQVGC